MCGQCVYVWVHVCEQCVGLYIIMCHWPATFPACRKNHLCVGACVNVCVSMCGCICVYLCVGAHVCLCVRAYVCVYVWVHMCVYEGVCHIVSLTQHVFKMQQEDEDMGKKEHPCSVGLDGHCV